MLELSIATSYGTDIRAEVLGANGSMLTLDNVLDGVIGVQSPTGVKRRVKVCGDAKHPAVLR